jgi:hypothetical protein
MFGLQQLTIHRLRNQRERSNLPEAHGFSQPMAFRDSHSSVCWHISSHLTSLTNASEIAEHLPPRQAARLLILAPPFRLAREG